MAQTSQNETDVCGIRQRTKLLLFNSIAGIKIIPMKAKVDNGMNGSGMGNEQNPPIGAWNTIGRTMSAEVSRAEMNRQIDRQG